MDDHAEAFFCWLAALRTHKECRHVSSSASRAAQRCHDALQFCRAKVVGEIDFDYGDNLGATP